MPSDELRLFLALWPDAAALQALQAHARQWRWPPAARRTRPERLHLTLHFIGAVPRARMDEVRRGLAVPCPSLALEFARPQLWPGGIAVLACDAPPPALLRLHADLAAALRALRLPVEARDFRAHVTLARHASSAAPPAMASPLPWTVAGGYLLVHSLPGGRGYETLARYG